MERMSKVFVIPAALLVTIFLVKTLLAEQEGTGKPSRAEVMQKTQKLRMPFIANKGQTDERVKFYANTFGGSVFVTEDGEIVYSLPTKSSKLEVQSIELKDRNTEVSGCLTFLCSESDRTGLLPVAMQLTQPWASRNISNPPFVKKDDGGFKSAIPNPKSEMKVVALKEELVGGKINEIKGEAKAVTKVNYFKGKDPSQWKTNISTYDTVTLGEIYKGIELKLKAYGNNVEKLFHVKPGASPESIQVKLSGAKRLRVNEEGQLEAETDLGTVKFTRPIAYQEIDGKRVEVAVEYDLQGSGGAVTRGQNTETNLSNPKSEYGFKVAAYDKSKELIIDPLLASTFLGGSYDDKAQSIAIDSVGNIFVTGHTLSSDFPNIPGGYDSSYTGSLDVFISKLDGDLTSLLASTYLGGSNIDDAWSIAIDSSGDVFVTGYTHSSNFPITPGIYDTSLNGSQDVFVSRLNGDLTSLLASTFLGGSAESAGSEWANSITIDAEGDVFVAGYTWSSDFPTTLGAYGTSHNGSQDAFVSKLNGDLTSLLASTFLGGSSTDWANSIIIDARGDVFVAGGTDSSDFPTTPGAYDVSHNGSQDAFVSKLNGDLTSLLAATFLGGSSTDWANSIIIDARGDVFIAGSTYSSDFSAVPGAYDTSYNSGEDTFVSKLNRDLTSLLAFTFLGGSGTDRPHSMAIDSGGNILVSGYTDSSDFPTIPSAYDSSFNGYEDAFVSRLKGDLTSLLASTFLGGSGTDRAYSIAINSGGNVLITGYTWSYGASDFPITPGAYDTSFNGLGVLSDAFVSKFNSNLSAQITPTPTPTASPTTTPTTTPNQSPVAKCKSVTVSADANCSANASIDDGSFDPDSGDSITIGQLPAGPYSLGQTTVTLTVTDSHNASSFCEAIVTVVDSTLPAITLKPSVTFWPSNHKYNTVTVSQMVQGASDSCDSLSISNVVVERVTSDEPEDAHGSGDGTTKEDIVIAADCKSVQLRAERDGKRNGRVYVITLRVRDASGNAAHADFMVTVPLNQNNTAIKDSIAYTVTSSCL